MSRTLLQLTSTKPRKAGKKPPLLELRIGDLAKATGKTQRALRLYEEMGLLQPASHTAGGFRVYGADAIERVRFIEKMKDLGFTLAETRELVVATSGPSVPKQSMARVRAVYEGKQAEVQKQIERLRQLQRELQSSLEYLETCVDSCTQGTGAQGTSCCGTCAAHGADKAPALVVGVRHGAAGDTPSSTGADA